MKYRSILEYESVVYESILVRAIPDAKAICKWGKSAF